ncbi:unnamed protein product [Rotaria sordida]|uniref:VWFA domain-containing protein n=1 Tax=Rotaria sordida TaxID=392033 RepID=A0A814E9G0_9BILA|nr:unnamed protein product [Rotaria sordida]CAF1023015.1 unnamed protein product [Rotaria sordida]
MATNNDDFKCKVCKNIYTSPVVHRLCGISFDRTCIGRICPAQECRQIINENDLIDNYTLLKIADEYRFTLEMPPTYYLFLLDTSTSMWYSDRWLPFVIGESRFTYAIEFLNDFFKLKLNKMTEKISLVTFDTSSLQRFDFEIIDETHLTFLQHLKCEGKDTALFDSIDFCLMKIEQLKTLLGNQMSSLYLFILTDGGNNFGKAESIHATQILWRSKKLHISGHIIQIGDKNRKKTRTICDLIKFKYNHFKGGNVAEFVKSFTNSITTEIRTRNAQVLSSMYSTTRMINQLPDVPNSPIKVPSKQKELG